MADSRATPGESLFAVGQRVRVKWIDGTVLAEVVARERARSGSRVFYLLKIAGVRGRPAYEAHEMEIVDTCCVCGEPGKSQHSGPPGDEDTFWLCGGCEQACDEVAREGQYVEVVDG